MDHARCRHQPQPRRSLVVDRAARVYYDEFLGQLARSVLGWMNVSANGDGVTAANGEDGRPGIAELSTGTQQYGYGMLMYQGNSIKLGGGLNHVVEVSISRVVGDSYAEWRGGFMQSSGEVGAYFKYGRRSGATNAKLKFICHDASREEAYDLGVSDDDALWFRYRIEVAPDAPELRVFRSGTANHPELLEPIFLQTCSLHIPTGLSLGFAFRITQDGEQTNRLLRVDYFQHQVH